MTEKNLSDNKPANQMTERELLILKMRFGIDMPNQETWTLHQIAKVFNISYERVRQIEARALIKLRNNPDMHELRHLVIEE